MKTCPSCGIKYPDALEFCPQDGTLMSGAQGGHTQALYDRFLGATIDGRYKVEAKLGEGGMGVVYAARHVIIEKRVAIKVLKKEAQADETAGQRFIQEARSASKIGHANIVDINDFGQLPDGSAYFVMEFLEGETLGQLIAKGPIPSARAVSIAAQMARGLQAAHKAGIVHRDLKPENIFLIERDGRPDQVKIVDFGIAKIQESGANGGQRLTQVGMVLGTPEYMSPEQATGRETDYRVDEYALGCMLYEMLTGDVPFKGNTSAQTLTKHVFDPVVAPRKRRPDLDISPGLESVVLKAMAKKPDERYPGMRELLEALDGAGAALGAAVRRKPRDGSGEDSSDRSPTSSERPTPTDAIPRTSRRPLIITASAAAAIAIGAVAWWAASTRGETHASSAASPAISKGAPVAPPSHPKVTPPPPPPSHEVIFTLRSTPPGAAIFVGADRLGTAPLVHRRARGTQPVQFVFRLAGYKDVSREFAPDGDHDVEVALLAKRDRVKAHAAADVAPPADKPVARPTQHVSDLRDPFN